MNASNAKDYLPIVQALSEGRQLQERIYVDVDEYSWKDCQHPEFDRYPAENYRIKPEPRELWVNELPNVGTVAFESEEQAIEHAKRYGIGHVTRRYREVLE